MPLHTLSVNHIAFRSVPHTSSVLFHCPRLRTNATLLRCRAVDGEPPAGSENPRGAELLVLSEEDKQYYKEVDDAGNKQGIDEACPSDYYELLGVEVDADNVAIRAAFRSLQRLVHPDVVGEQGNGLSILLNHAYTILTDDALREAYNKQLAVFRQENGSYDGKPVSRWLGAASEQRAVFVDETTCIGCTNCCGVAQKTFFMEDDWGRARVRNQWGDGEDTLREAMDMCPVDCIHFVKRKQLALLEYVMKWCKREDIAILARRRSGNMGAAPACENPFTRAEVFLRRREQAKTGSELEEENGNGHVVQDPELAATIAKAWLELKPELRAKGWPSWYSSAAVVGT